MPVTLFLIWILSSYISLSACSTTVSSRSPSLNAVIPNEKLTVNVALCALSFFESIESRSLFNIVCAFLIGTFSLNMRINSSPPYLITGEPIFFSSFVIKIRTLSMILKLNH